MSFLYFFQCIIKQLLDSIFSDIQNNQRLSLRSRREWVPARTSVQNASAKSRSSREKNGEESREFCSRLRCSPKDSPAGEACEGISGFAVKSFARAPTPASYAGYQRLGKGYQPQSLASADNPYLDLDYSGYYKNLIQ